MAKGRLNSWRSLLQIVFAGLMGIAAFAPLPETSERILTGVAVGGLLVYSLTDSESRKIFLLSTAPLVALVLLALVLSVNPKWVVFGYLACYGVSLLWGILRLEHNEYLAEERKRAQ